MADITKLGHRIITASSSNHVSAKTLVMTMSPVDKVWVDTETEEEEEEAAGGAIDADVGLDRDGGEDEEETRLPADTADRMGLRSDEGILGGSASEETAGDGAVTSAVEVDTEAEAEEE